MPPITNSWAFSMVAAGACSAGAILLIRDIPKYAGGIPASLTVAMYMLLGGLALLMVTAGQHSAAGGKLSITWPSFGGMAGIAAIGVLLALLELFFVFGARQSMPMPDAMIVYNVSSLALLTFVGVVFMGESLNWARLAGMGLGLGSMLLLLQPVKS